MTHDPLGKLRDDVAFLLEEALHSLRLEEARAGVRKALQLAPPGKGDFAYPCFPLAKAMRKSPADAAKELVAALPPRAGVTAVAEGPYVNFTADPRALARDTLAAVESGLRYGTHPSNGTPVIVEHTSANPNGPFHVGRARNPIVGDTLARTLRAAGYDVTTEYYVNDMGKQVAILNWGLRNLRREELPPTDRAKVDHQNVGFYQKANELQEADPAIAAAIGASLHRFENGDRATADEFREAVTLILTGMRESLARMNVHMDRYSYESEYVFNGSVQEVVKRLKGTPLAREDESGSWYLDLESYGIAGRNSRWTFLRKDGTTLYTTRDLAYHQDKFQRAQLVVNVLGEDHKLTMQQLDIALDLLGVNKHPEVLWISFVSLPEGKMSTRRNRVVFIDDLLDESVARAREEVDKRRPELSEAERDRIAEVVGIGAVRFNIARVQTEKSIVFRWEDALNFEGDSAPFVQYAHARASSILRKAAEAGARIGGEPGLAHASEVELVKAIAKLPYVVREAAELRRIHMLPAYAVELTNAFNAFYRDCPVMVEDEGVRAPRLALVRAAKVAIANTLGLLGIEAPESM
ncbi:MAG TPA: arginine--tRNA ligase [Candidatus Thermoplasmatota archaeon]|nr:arginine--tRNA ligase [Candidatus Thermoplasmatota archaeon]